ncbi:MAG: putative hydro-lyase [Armatimonadetes bacterium]|nr:putative hydro-lyase [Armatimonadota bacterium]
MAHTELAGRSPREIRQIIREGEWRRPTAGLAPGYVQTNLVILPRDLAFDFLLFCQRNPRPCPLLEVTEPGDPEPRGVVAGADLRVDLPRYRVYRDGVLAEERTDIRDLWQPDLVAFLLGCSFTFEAALIDAGIPLRHIDRGCNVSMYITSIECRPAGAFYGPMVVSMRAIRAAQVVRAVQVTSRFPGAHGAPVHVGDPRQIGIADLNRPDFGDLTAFEPGEAPVFWACGVTPQAVAMRAKPPFMITHAPGHMFLTDMRDSDLAVL